MRRAVVLKKGRLTKLKSRCVGAGPLDCIASGDTSLLISTQK